MHHLGISVTNLERSMRFYRDVVGADLLVGPHDGTSPSFEGRMAILSLGGCIFDLYAHSRNQGEGFDPARTGDRFDGGVRPGPVPGHLFGLDLDAAARADLVTYVGSL